MKYDITLAYPKPTNDSPVSLTPLSILYPGALFESQGKKVAYFDARFDSDEMLEELIMNSKEIAVSAFTGYQTGQAADILIKAKQLNPDIITAVGGYHAQIFPEDVLAEDFVDKVYSEQVYGEDLFPYNERTKHHYERTEMQYFTSRGCPHQCTFCALKSLWIPKDIKTIEHELTTLHKDIPFTEISFSDPNMTFGNYFDKNENKTHRMDRVQRIKDIGRILNKLGVKWDGNLRTPYLTKEMVQALEESGCYSLEVGCESGNDYFLKKIIKKGHGVDAIKEAVLNVKDANFSVMYSFMAQMPRETHEMLMDTLDLIDWIVATDPHARISIYSYAPYPPGPMYEDAINGAEGYPKFTPPKTMKGWASQKLMASPIYWICGLNFRMDNTRRNFPGEDWKLIEPYVELARKKWKERDIYDFPCEEVEALIQNQLNKKRDA